MTETSERRKPEGAITYVAELAASSHDSEEQGSDVT